VSDDKVIQFPRRGASASHLPGRPPQTDPTCSTRVPFSVAALREIAEHLNAAYPELLDALARAGGSAVTEDFLDYLWELSGGVVAAETF
jgi:hypothetical protein